MHGTKGAGRKPRNAKKTISRLMGYIGKYKLLLLLVAVLVVISSGATIAGTYFLKPIINDYITPLIGQEDPDMSGFIGLLCVMGAIYVLGIISSYSYNRIMVKICTSTMSRIRVDMFNHMEKLPLSYFDKRTHGEIMSSYTNDTDTLREMIGQSIPQILSSVISVVGVFVMMLILSPLLTLIVIAIIALMLFVIKFIGGKSGKYFVAQQQAIGKVNGYIEEMVEGQKVVKVFNHEDETKADFAAVNEKLCETSKNAHTFANILMPIMGNLSYLLYAITAVCGGYAVVRGITDIGTIASFLQYTRNFSNPITMVSQQMNAILMALAGAERIFALIDEDVETDEGTVTLVNAERVNGELTESEKRTGLWAWKKQNENGEYEFIELKGDVRFNNVTFGYVPEKAVLKNISLFAKPGQKIAFVGSTGAGKTTITNLINRFYDVDEGSITYDGIDVKHIKKDDLRRSLGIVLQDTHLFTGTVMENLRYGRLDATDEEIIAAAKNVNAHTFIKHLPKGYETELTADGANLSQGQRQLLAIARAAVADPPVLILDEATSSIDTRTEALIEKGMDKLMEGRTVFVIAHRLSTVRNSNAIIVLEHGEIIERGDHDDLLEQHGRYYKLYMGMFELD